MRGSTAQGLEDDAQTTIVVIRTAAKRAATL